MSKINLQEMFLKQVQSAYKIELAKAEKCCESCRDRMLESQIYFEYGYTAALSDLQDKVEKLVEALKEHYAYAQECRNDWSDYDGRTHLAVASSINHKALSEFKNGESK